MYRISTSRGSADSDSYVRGMLRARYCVVPMGDTPTPGRRLVDAVAAGCVPIIVGEGVLPFGRILDYRSFAGMISRGAFLRDAVDATEGLLAKLEPRYPALLRALADARQRLLYGTGDFGPYHNKTRLGDVGELLLRELRATLTASVVAPAAGGGGAASGSITPRPAR